MNVKHPYLARIAHDATFLAADDGDAVLREYSGRGAYEGVNPIVSVHEHRD